MVLAINWQMLAGLRGLMGFAEGSAQPGGMKAVAEWFPAKERGFAGGFYNIGASFGSMLAAPLVAWAILFHSWRLAFVIAGAAALVWVAVWFRFYYSPKQHPRCRTRNASYIESGQETHLAAGAAKPSMLEPAQAAQFLGHRDAALARRSDLGHADLLVPLYLIDRARASISSTSRCSPGCRSWPPISAACSAPTIALWLQKRGVSLINARALRFTVGALLMTGMMFVGQVQTLRRRSRCSASAALRIRRCRSRSSPCRPTCSARTKSRRSPVWPASAATWGLGLHRCSSAAW